MANPNTNAPYEYDKWSFSENKEFEICVALGYLDIEDESTRWRDISLQLGQTKTPEEVENHYKKLVHDVELIESGQVPLPRYADYDDHDDDDDDDHDDDDVLVTPSVSCTPSLRPMKKASQWTEEEHRLFLIGVAHYGKGDWKTISRNVVKTRSPTQVASHAQKYFSRASTKKNSKRSSIHDITQFDDDCVLNLCQKGLLSSEIALDLSLKGYISSDVVKALQTDQQLTAMASYPSQIP